MREKIQTEKLGLMSPYKYYCRSSMKICQHRLMIHGRVVCGKKNGKCL